MPIGAVVADANVLLSAIIGKAALRVFTQYRLEVHVAEFNARKVQEYLPRMADRYGLPPEVVLLQWRLLPITTHGEARYARRLPEAQEDLRARDPEDAHALALARQLGLPLWSNDRDLTGHGVSLLTTAKLLKLLDGGRS